MNLNRKSDFLWKTLPLSSNPRWPVPEAVYQKRFVLLVSGRRSRPGRMGPSCSRWSPSLRDRSTARPWWDTHTHAHTHTLTLMQHTHTHSHTHSLSHSATQPLSHSATHSLTQPLTQPLTHSATHSATQPLAWLTVLLQVSHKFCFKKD